MDSPELNNAKKENWSKWLRILNEGRNDFLGFIGALSGQILLGTFAAVVYHSIDFNRFDLGIDNVIITASFFVLLLIIVLGIAANTMRLYEGCGFHMDQKTWPIRLEMCLVLFVAALINIVIVPVMSVQAASNIVRVHLHEPAACPQANATR